MNDLIERYLSGPRELRAAIEGLSAEQLDATPIPGAWSTRQVVAHIADCEPVYADRMTRVIAEEEPPLQGLDPDVFAARLAYGSRDVEEELRLIEALRAHVATILRTLPESDFERVGIHSRDGRLSLRELLERITGHIPHHVAFVREKRKAMGLS